MDILYYKGNTFNTPGNYQEAISYYDKVLEIDPNNVNALYAKGLYLLGDLGNHYFSKIN